MGGAPEDINTTNWPEMQHGRVVHEASSLTRSGSGLWPTCYSLFISADETTEKNALEYK